MNVGKMLDAAFFLLVVVAASILEKKLGKEQWHPGKEAWWTHVLTVMNFKSSCININHFVQT